MTVHSIDWSRQDWKTIRQGVEQKAFSGQGATLALHRLQPGRMPDRYPGVHAPDHSRNGCGGRFRSCLTSPGRLVPLRYPGILLAQLIETIALPIPVSRAGCFYRRFLKAPV